ncbi:Dbl homology domain-containing protein [Sporodiniella umbellata]|nr:Dbl homology domain-containing protein [Sporodiniella umbellata]
MLSINPAIRNSSSIHFASISSLPSPSITNQPSHGRSLLHTCRSVLEQLVRLEVIPAEERQVNDPLNRLWALCRQGFPLTGLFNALVRDEAHQLDSARHEDVKKSKKQIYYFIVKCSTVLGLREEELFTLSDVYGDTTNGLVKVIHTIQTLLDQLEPQKEQAQPVPRTTPKDTRDNVVLELLETERKYVQDLEVLQRYRRECQLQSILNEDGIHYLFGNLNTLMDFQRRFLFALEEVVEKPGQEQDLGGLFRGQEEGFKVYEPYCTNYFSAQDLVVQETPKLQKVADWLNPVYELPSMLIKPVQRICKYPLLLQQLIKATPADWPTHALLQAGYDSIRRVAQSVNETQRRYENRQVLNTVKRCVGELPPAEIEAFGELLLHDRLPVSPSETAEKEMRVYLFDRALLFCKEHPSGASLSMKKKKPVLQPKGIVRLHRVLSLQTLPCQLRICWREREVDQVSFRFRNAEQLGLWELALRQRIQPKRCQVSNSQLVSMPRRPWVIPAFLKDSDSEDDLPPVSLRSQSYARVPTLQSQPARMRSQSSPNIRPAPFKLKLNFRDGIYVIMAADTMGYADLVDRADRKIRLVANLPPDPLLRLKYKDEDGDLITINSDEDVQMAFEAMRGLRTLHLFVTV